MKNLLTVATICAEKMFYLCKMCTLTEIFSERIVSSQNFGKAAAFYFLVPSFLNQLCTLRRECTYSEFFWYVFSSIRIKYEDLPSKYPHSVQVTENSDQKK